LITPWDTLSGTALQFRQEIVYLANQTEVMIFSEMDSSHIPKISVPSIPYEKCWSRKVGNLDRLMKGLEKFNPDIVHLIHEANWFGVDQRLEELSEFCKDHRMKFIIQFESPMPQWMEYFAELKCDGYLSSSYPEENTILEELGLHNVQYIPKPIPEGPMIPREEAQKTIGYEGKRILLNTGFQRQASGYSEIIKGIAPILAKNKDIIFIAAGCEHYDEFQPSKFRDEAMKLAGSLGVDSQIIFTNKFHSEKELFTYGSASDIYIHYRSKAMFFFASGSIGRAFSFELPAVAYDHPSIDDIPRGMVRIHSTDQLEQAIELLLTNTSYYNRLKKEVLEIKAERSPENTSKKLLEYYMRIMS
jgi:glycosyltransferase involved in cell wall biosynthesis